MIFIYNFLILFAQANEPLVIATKDKQNLPFLIDLKSTNIRTSTQLSKS